MAGEGIWQPREEGLREICSVLEQHISPTSDKPRGWQQLQHYTQFPDFNNYLVFIFAHAQGASVEIRQAAGLLLKNNLRSAFESLDPAYLQYIKSLLLPCLGEEKKDIRNTAGTIISVIVQQGRICGWPELLGALVQCLDSNDINHMEGALDTLSKISEDTPFELDSDVPGLHERPIDVFLPRLVQLFQSPHASLRKLSLGSVNQFIMLMPTALYLSMDRYLQGLFFLSHDPVAEVKKLVCAALVQLIEVTPSFLEPYLKNVIEFMLIASQDADHRVALEACEFWSTYCEAPLNPEVLRECLEQLIPVLLSNMVYADDDESLIDAEEDESVPDRDQDLKPRFHSSRFHGSEDMIADDDDSLNVWNLRKCSAAGIDALSNVFGDEILPMLMPLVQEKLSTSDDGSWKEREAAVLALGAVAEGCIRGLYPHLPEIVEFLLPVLDDKFPLLRSITCWTLSRFSKFIVQGIGHQKGYEQFNKILMGLLRRILDTKKRVQEAACSAFATLEEEAAEKLTPHLEIILQHLLCAYGRYQKKNLLILYDAIGTLAEAVGEELNQPRYLQILMPPLIAKWQQLSDADKDLSLLLECFTSIAKALGAGFSQFAQPVLQRCINIIQTQQLEKVDPSSAEVLYEKEFIVCFLDLVSVLVESLGSGIESLVSQSNLRDQLVQCCLDDSIDVRKSALALLGDLARVNQEVSPIVMTVVSSIVPVLQHAEGADRSLVENSAITLGRLAWVCPEIVSPHMEHFMREWCTALSTIRDDMEKEEAFRGLCAIVRTNPPGALNSLSYICRAVASWHVIRSEELQNGICQILVGYKQLLKDGGWEQCLSTLEPQVREKLSNYGV